MSTPDASITRTYSFVQVTVERKLPYVFGGGHDLSSPFKPSIGNVPLTIGVGPIGYDCSGLVSAALHAGGILGHPFPIGTHELENWGLPGEGEFFTVWVLNDSMTEHAVMQFKLPAHTQHHFIAARHTGTIIEWYPATEPANFVVQGYHPRRRA